MIQRRRQLRGARRARSPIRLVKKPLLFGIVNRTWVCDDDAVAAAEFRRRQNPREFAILHRSTKKRDTWQLSFFDDQGAVRDVQAPSCAIALREVPHWQWRLRQVTRR